MKKTISMLLATTLLATTLVGCGGGASSAPAASDAPAASGSPASSDTATPAASSTPTGDLKTYTLKYAELNPNDHIMDQCGDKFAELVSAKSNGRITIEVFPAGQLGDEKTMYQTIQMGGGAIDICRGNTNSLGDFGAKKLTLFGLPFIFRDRAHLWNVLNSELGNEFLGEMQELGSGMVGLFYLDEGSRNFFTRGNVEIKDIASFKGLKLRVPTNDLMSDTAASLGVQSTPISFSELYSALQTGTVDGAEQPHSGYFSNKFFEVAPNYALTGHTYSPSIVLMSEKAWSGLDEEAQKIIMEAADETEQWNRESIEKLDAQLLEDIKAAGANVIEITDKTPFVEATKGVVEKYATGLETYYNEILAK